MAFILVDRRVVDFSHACRVPRFEGSPSTLTSSGWQPHIVNSATVTVASNPDSSPGAKTPEGGAPGASRHRDPLLKLKTWHTMLLPLGSRKSPRPDDEFVTAQIRRLALAMCLFPEHGPTMPPTTDPRILKLSRRTRPLHSLGTPTSCPPLWITLAH